MFEQSYSLKFEGTLTTSRHCMYVTECAPDKNRGFASTALIFASVIGRMFLFSLGSPGVLGRTETWFVFPSFVGVCSLLMLLMTIRLPESPKWLVCQNRGKDARKAVEYYHGSNADIDEVLISYTKEKNLTEEARLSFRQILGDETLREALGVLFSITFFFLLDSTSTQAVYSVTLYKDAGFTVQETMNISLILVIVFFPTKFIGTYIIDALGRRPVMFLAGVICFGKSILIIITELIIYYIDVSVECLTNAIPGTGVTNLHVLFITELFPPSARTSVAQVMLITAMMIDTPLLALFPFVYSIFPPGFFFPFVIAQAVFGVYLYKHMPETNGRAVYDIIESMEQVVTSRAQSLIAEKTPLLRDRARSLAVKRNSILNTSRARASTYDQQLIPRNIHIY